MPPPPYTEEMNPPQATPPPPLIEKASPPQAMPPPSYTKEVNPQAPSSFYTRYFIPARFIGFENISRVEGSIFLRIRWASLTQVEIFGEATKCWYPQAHAQVLPTKALLMSFGDFYLAMENWRGRAKSREVWLHMAALKTEVKARADENAADYLMAKLERAPCFIKRSNGLEGKVIEVVRTQNMIIIKTLCWDNNGANICEESITNSEAALTCMARCHHNKANWDALKHNMLSWEG